MARARRRFLAGRLQGERQSLVLAEWDGRVSECYGEAQEHALTRLPRPMAPATKARALPSFAKPFVEACQHCVAGCWHAECSVPLVRRVLARQEAPMYRWLELTFMGTIAVATACGGSDRHADTPADAQGGPAHGEAGPSEATGVPPAGSTPPTTPNSEPSNLPPESSVGPGWSDLSTRSMLSAPGPLGDGGSSFGSGGRTQSGGSTAGGRRNP